MKKRLTFNGTGAVVYLCLGVVPDAVQIRALEDGDCGQLVWDKAMLRAAECVAGILYGTGTTYIAGANKTVGTGIEPYKGGDIMTAALQTSTTYGEGVYLAVDPIEDYRTVGANVSGESIGKWTLGSSSNKTGNFDKEASTTYIGEGSRVKIDGIWYTVMAMSSNGEAANEVTLNQAAPSGTIQQITGMYDLAPLAIGKVAPAGVKLSMTAVVNVNDEMQAVEFESESANA
jgi:hypothetical protein